MGLYDDIMTFLTGNMFGSDVTQQSQEATRGPYEPSSIREETLLPETPAMTPVPRPPAAPPQSFTPYPTAGELETRQPKASAPVTPTTTGDSSFIDKISQLAASPLFAMLTGALSARAMTPKWAGTGPGMAAAMIGGTKAMEAVRNRREEERHRRTVEGQEAEKIGLSRERLGIEKEDSQLKRSLYMTPAQIQAYKARLAQMKDPLIERILPMIPETPAFAAQFQELYKTASNLEQQREKLTNLMEYRDRLNEIRDQANQNKAEAALAKNQVEAQKNQILAQKAENELLKLQGQIEQRQTKFEADARYQYVVAVNNAMKNGEFGLPVTDPKEIAAIRENTARALGFDKDPITGQSFEPVSRAAGSPVTPPPATGAAPSAGSVIQRFNIPGVR